MGARKEIAKEIVPIGMAQMPHHALTGRNLCSYKIKEGIVHVKQECTDRSCTMISRRVFLVHSYSICREISK